MIIGQTAAEKLRDQRRKRGAKERPASPAILARAARLEAEADRRYEAMHHVWMQRAARIRLWRRVTGEPYCSTTQMRALGL
jgi:hypothetical protein